MKDNRSKKIDVRFTEEEYKVVLALEKELGIRKSDLIRIKVLNNAPNVVINAKELISQLDEIGTELGRSGNNVNQFARYVNILTKKSVLSPVVAERFNMLFEQYITNQKILETALRRIIRSMGN